MLISKALILFRDFSRFWLSCLGPLVLFFPKLQIIWLSNLSNLSVPDEGYSRNKSCALNLISAFLFLVTFSFIDFVV